MSAVRLLYIHSQHLAVAGQRAVASSHLLDFLKAELDQVITAHMVVDDDSTRTAHPSFLDHVVTIGEIGRKGINVIYCEGGIETSFSDGGRMVWKMSRDRIEEFSHFALFWSKNCLNAPWVEFELGAAISACVEQGKPILVVALDETPVPPGIRQFVRIGAAGSPDEAAKGLADALAGLQMRASGVLPH